MGSMYTKPAEKESKHYPALVESLPSQDGKTHVVTGTTSGTGFVYAYTIARLGGKVVCLNRKSERAEKSMEKLNEMVPNGDFTMVECDLKSFESVQKAADEVKSMFGDEGIYSLVNNAGVMALPDEACEGYDVQMHVNHLSHFLLTKELYPLLKKGAEKHGDARIVNHSSIARLAPGTELQRKYFEKNGGNLGGNGNGIAMNGPRWERYHQTKLANAVFSYALADRLDEKKSKIRSGFGHPGLAATNLQVTTTQTGGMWQNPLTSLFMSFAQSSEDGAMGIIMCGAGKPEDVPNASFYGPGGGSTAMSGNIVQIDRSKEKLADSQAAKDLLWEASEAAVGKFEVN